MYFDVISSGSKGNATLVLSHGKALLLDFGISRRRVEKALSSYGLGFLDVEAFLLTHGHEDHASDILSAPLEKVYAPYGKLSKDKELPKEHVLVPFQKLFLDPFVVTVLPVSHDFPNTMAFLADDGKEKLAYVTDTGFIPEKLFPYLKDADYLLLESNHDSKMLYESKRPDYLIRRIISDKGHLNNTDCGCYFSLFIGEHTKECVLLHLSEECNKKEIALETVQKTIMGQLGYLPDVLFKCSSAREETKGGKE